MEAMLAARTSSFPEPSALPGGCWYEPKWDGFRLIATIADAVRLTSRRGADLTKAFPEIAHALVEQLADCVVDGELVVWRDDRLDFAALQRRSSAGASRTKNLAAENPANLVIFDLLAVDGDDLTGRPYRDRRQLLERVGATVRPPLSVTPATDDPDVAKDWFERYAQVGVEGLVAKGADQPYRYPDRRPGHALMVQRDTLSQAT